MMDAPTKMNEEQEILRVSGTLDNIAQYIKEVYNFSYDEATKVAFLLFFQQECEFSEKESQNLPKFSKDDIENFLYGNWEDSQKAQGMLGSTRIFFSFTEAKVRLMREVPIAIIKELILGGCELDNLNWPLHLFSAFTILSSCFQSIKDAQVCVCCQAWQQAKKNKTRIFSLESLLPETDSLEREPICLYTQEDGEKRYKLAHWKCPHYNKKQEHNGCDLNKNKILDLIQELEKIGVVEPVVENKKYRFL